MSSLQSVHVIFALFFVCIKLLHRGQTSSLYSYPLPSPSSFSSVSFSLFKPEISNSQFLGSKFSKHVLVFKSEHQFWGGSVTLLPSSDTTIGTPATEVSTQGNAGSNEEKLSSTAAAAANGGVVELSGRVTQVGAH